MIDEPVMSATVAESTSEKLTLGMIPGAIMEMDPDEADMAGAFEETSVPFGDVLLAMTDDEG